MTSRWQHLSLAGVAKSYRDTRGAEYCAARGIDIRIARGDFYCLLGPSGCGKSTLLNLVAGFEPPSAGVIRFVGADGERPVLAAGADRAVIFQDAGEALFPWLSVEENVLFGPRTTGADRAASRERLGRYLRMVGLSAHGHKYPFELSGGMKQRVQIARALIMQPEMLLMDEPFAALDAITKRLLQRELAQIWQETGTTVVYVTHDLVEALLLATRIAVMTAGPAAGIKREIEVDLPRPRDPADPAFAAAMRMIESLLDEEVQAARAAEERAT